VATDVGFQYGLARFIDFRDEAECERVRRIPREELTAHANPDFRIASSTRRRVLPGSPRIWSGESGARVTRTVTSSRSSGGAEPQYEIARG